MEKFSCDYKMKTAPNFIALNLEKCLNKAVSSIVLLFIGSDCNVGDSLAPICGELIKVNNKKVFLYGSLNIPITAKEAPFMAEFVKKAHPGSLVVAIDAALGKSDDVGLIKVHNGGIKPGLGVNKDLPMVGDVSIIGVLAEKTAENGGFKGVRLNTVYEMAKIIALGLEIFIKNNEKRLNFYKFIGESDKNA